MVVPKEGTRIHKGGGVAVPECVRLFGDVGREAWGIGAPRGPEKEGGDGGVVCVASVHGVCQT